MVRGGLCGAVDWAGVLRGLACGAATPGGPAGSARPGLGFAAFLG